MSNDVAKYMLANMAIFSTQTVKSEGWHRIHDQITLPDRRIRDIMGLRAGVPRVYYNQKKEQSPRRMGARTGGFLGIFAPNFFLFKIPNILV